MPTRNQTNTLVNDALTQQGSSDRITGSELRAASQHVLDYVDQQDTAGTAALDAAVADLEDQIGAIDGSDTEISTAVSFTTSIPFNKLNSTMSYNGSGGAQTLTPNTTGAIKGGGCSLEWTADGNSAHKPDVSAFFVLDSSQPFDETDGTVNLYLFNKMGPVYAVTNIPLTGVVVDTTLDTPTLSADAVSDTQINLTSITYDADSTAMTIERATNVGFTTGVASIYTGVPKTSHNDTGRTASTHYYYRVKTTAPGFTDSDYGTDDDTTDAAGLTALDTPTLSAALISPTQITLTLGTVASESSYKLEWSPNGSNTWTQIGGTIAANTATYDHTGLTAATHYYYRLSAIGDGVTFSNSGYGTDDDTTQSLIALTAPGSFTLTADSDTTATAAYGDIANESGFSVQIATNAGFTTGVQTASKGVGVLSHQFTGLVASTLYYGRSKGVGDGITYSDSAYSTSDSDTTDAAADSTPPTLVSATVENATPSQVDLVFSEAMNATWSAAAAFAVTGHTVSSVTRTGATTGYLTLSAPFVGGETARTLAYTQPGSNKMQDTPAGNLLANITAASITNNVASLTEIYHKLFDSTVSPFSAVVDGSNTASISGGYLYLNLLAAGICRAQHVAALAGLYTPGDILHITVTMGSIPQAGTPPQSVNIGDVAVAADWSHMLEASSTHTYVADTSAWGTTGDIWLNGSGSVAAEAYVLEITIEKE